MTEEARRGWREWVDGIAVLSSTALAVVTLLGLVPPPFRTAALLLSLMTVSLVVTYARQASAFAPAARIKRFHPWVRQSATVTCLLAAGGLLTYWPLEVRAYYLTPVVGSIRPIQPVAGAEIEIIGRNIVPGALSVYFDSVEVTRILEAGENRIRCVIPDNVASGPIRVITRSSFAFLPDLTGEFAVGAVHSPRKRVLVLGEMRSPDRRSVTGLFSIVNTLPDQEVTVTDVTLETLLAEPLGPNLQQERIDLGTLQLVSGDSPETRRLVPTTRLLNDKAIVRLPAKRSDSFRYRIERLDQSLSARVIVALSATYYDDQGRAETAYADLLWQLDVDIDGFRLATPRPFNRDVIHALRTQYGTRLRLPAGWQ